MQTLVAVAWVTFVDMQYQQQKPSLDAHAFRVRLQTR